MKNLKKIALKVPLNAKYEIFDLIERYEVLKIHRCDYDQITVTQKVKFKDDNMHPKQLEGIRPNGWSYIEVLEENREKNEFIFFSKFKWFEETWKFYDKVDLIIDPPLMLDQNWLLVRVIIESTHIDELFDHIEICYDGKIEVLSISNLNPDTEDLFLKLTNRQKEIAYYAVQHGFFEIPRKIDSEKIANHFNISQSALYEHLRKIERTIYHSIFN